MKLNKLPRIAATILCAGALLLPVGCGSEEDDDVTVGYVELSEIEDTTSNEWHENSEDGAANDAFPEGYKEVSYTSLTEVLLALENGDVDFIGTSANTARYICDANEGYQSVDTDSIFFYKMAMLEENEELCDDIDEAIEEIKSSVELYDLIDTYITNYATAPSPAVAANPDYPTYQVGVTGNVPPLDYIDTDGTPSGFNVAILNLIGEKIGVNFEYVSLDANARTTALVSGNIDLIFCENINGDGDIDEFEFEDTKLLLTDYYYSDTGTFVTKDYPVEKIQEMFGLEDTTISSLDDLAGKKIGVIAGSYTEELGNEIFTDSEIIPIESHYDISIALNNGSVDAIIDSKNKISKMTNVEILDECLGSIDCGIVLGDGRTALQKEMTALVEKYENDGTLEELQKKWIESDDLSDVTVDVDKDYPAKNGTLKVFITESQPPYAYYDGEYKGYCYELVLMLCKESGYQIEYISSDALEDEDVDIDIYVSSLAITPEREENMLFVKTGITTEYYVGVRK